MPSKKRTQKEKELDNLFKELGIFQKSKLSLNNDLSAGFNSIITQVDKEGDLVLNPKVGTGGNDMRKADRQDFVKYLKKRYPDFGKRGTAKQIAELEGLSVSTVQKYVKDFP